MKWKIAAKNLDMQVFQLSNRANYSVISMGDSGTKGQLSPELTPPSC